MKLIKEEVVNKDALPIEFITMLVSKGWDEVGNIKANIEGIRKEFKNIEDVEAILQDLSDAYLICIGRLEKYLNNNDYVDLPAEEEKAEEEAKEEVVEEPAEAPVEEDPALDTEDAKEINDDVHYVEAPADDDFNLDFDDAEIDASDVSRFKEWRNR